MEHELKKQKILQPTFKKRYSPSQESNIGDFILKKAVAYLSLHPNHRGPILSDFSFFTSSREETY